MYAGTVIVREERFAQLVTDAEKLAWFFKMVESGGPDLSDLDHAVWLDAQEAAKRILKKEVA